MRAWLIGLAAILVVAVVAVWQVPQYLDWNRYRATLEALASTTLGRPVTIHGPITLNLLPQPVLTAAQVSIGGDAAADVSIRVEALRMRVALWPLLGGGSTRVSWCCADLTCLCRGLPSPLRCGGARRRGSPLSPRGSKMAD